MNTHRCRLGRSLCVCSEHRSVTVGRRRSYSVACPSPPRAFHIDALHSAAGFSFYTRPADDRSNDLTLSRALIIHKVLFLAPSHRHTLLLPSLTNPPCVFSRTGRRGQNNITRKTIRASRGSNSGLSKKYTETSCKRSSCPINGKPFVINQ